MFRKNLITLFWVGFAINLLIFLIDVGNKTIENFFYGLLICMIYTYFIGLSNGLVNDYLSKKFSWIDQTRTRTILGITGAILVNVVVCYLCGYLNHVVIQKNATTEEFFSEKYAFVNWFTINIALLISAFFHAKGFMEAWKSSSRKEVVEQKIIAKSANAQFESLKNQLDPHFLFNSLNVLDALIEENPAQAQRFTNSMSKIYRYVLDQKDKEMVTVQEELDFAKTYCELLKTRFEDSVSFDFDVEENVINQFVVPLSLQLLLENAIKHNFATSKKPLNIRIFSENEFLCIQNNLQAREIMKEREGIGLSNIVQRYSMLTDKNVFIEKSEDYFKVKIPMLNSKASSMKTENISSDQNQAYEKAARRVKELKEFYGSLVSYCVVMPILVFINFRTSSYQWFWFPLLGWGMGIAIQGLKTFAIGKNWEEKKINEIMKKSQDYE